jgi:hypothetical protein
METVFAADRAQWRRWLNQNFARCDEIWLVFYKKASGKTRGRNQIWSAWSG